MAAWQAIDENSRDRPGKETMPGDRQAARRMRATPVRGRRPTVRPRKPRGLGHERYDEILAAAKQLFISDGFEAVTTRRLADEVGLSQTGLYVYFKSKEEILDALCERTFARLAQRLRKVAADAPTSLDLFRRMVKGYIEFGLQNPDEYQLTFMLGREAPKERHTKDLSLRFEDQSPAMQAFLMFREQLARLAEAGLVKPVDVTVATQTIHMAAHGVVAMLIARPRFSWGDRRVLVDRLIETLLTGLAR
jgi:AcrR family transcriptional regulator